MFISKYILFGWSYSICGVQLKVQCHQISSDAATADYKCLDYRDYLFAWPENNELLITRDKFLLTIMYYI